MQTNYDRAQAPSRVQGCASRLPAPAGRVLERRRRLSQGYASKTLYEGKVDFRFDYITDGAFLNMEMQVCSRIGQ